ncbi:MAG: bifunctional demethylmenaquinone methyltransferase/2-methoxy-6-polyprenyl-1,4-benzoquinol methylase UbiE [Planctomycetota bacterium]|nr:bifunctional demethylmenaquinone methyltransferase/2-methoxy-6-polyprenyl-1,4-benzoquinol methylase UbiE [Planctomycetota bacterium]MDA1214212.1 bifunctional demethylmenaquinone methyltransferase/2-methoxy-6-polyprenyl-1,4-benzoquinol methylase UbiE [Planctomycetota bacterium]
MTEGQVDKSETRIRRMFGEISPRYDFLNHFLSGGVDYYWRWRTVRTVPPVMTQPILDVCTGTGDLALAYWNAAGRKIPVIGSDFTHEMLVIACDKASSMRSRDANEKAPVHFFEADTQQLPFRDDTYQIVSVAFGLRNVTNTRKGLNEMFRVCCPQGHVAILEFSMPTNLFIRGMYRFYFRYILPRIGQLLARNQSSAYNYLPQSVSEFPQGEALAELLRQAGFVEVQWKPLTFGIATLYFGRKPSTI